MNAKIPAKFERWLDAGLIDAPTAQRIADFEEQRGGGRRIAIWIAIAFGVVLLCAGVLMFVSAHWDNLGPWARFTLVLAMVAVFHLAAMAAIREQHSALAMALHGAGTVAAGGGIFMVGQIFNLAEHWPGGILMWALAATAGWWLLRDWLQTGIMALLWPAWVMGEWVVRVSDRHYSNGEYIVALMTLTLAIAYFTTGNELTEEERSGREKVFTWIGGLALLPALFVAPWAIWDSIGESSYGFFRSWGKPMPMSLHILGWAIAFLPALALMARRGGRVLRGGALAMLWVLVLVVICRQIRPEENLLLYMWMMAGGSGMVWWGMTARRKARLNIGIVIFAMAVIWFYFSDFLSKLDRSIFFVGLGVSFLLGGWLLERMRRRLLTKMQNVEAQ
jgi:uncharacterized membrane protein